MSEAMLDLLLFPAAVPAAPVAAADLDLLLMLGWDPGGPAPPTGGEGTYIPTYRPRRR